MIIYLRLPLSAVIRRVASPRPRGPALLRGGGRGRGIGQGSRQTRSLPSTKNPKVLGCSQHQRCRHALDLTDSPQLRRIVGIVSAHQPRTLSYFSPRLRASQLSSAAVREPSIGVEELKVLAGSLRLPR